MTLTTAVNIATRSLNMDQQGITTSSNNVANIATPGYIRQQTLQESIVVNGVGQGAQIVGISANVDAELLTKLRSQLSSLGNTGILEEFYNSIQRLYGQPGEDNTLSSEVANFFSAYQALSNNPETPSLRVAALNAANDVAAKISGIATDLHQLRFDADKQIYIAINTINSAIEDIEGYNTEIINYTENSSGYVNIKQKMNEALKKIAEFLNISITYDSRGRASILTGNGTSLIDDATSTRLEYNPVTSVNTFITDASLNAIKIRVLNTDGTPSDTTFDLSTSGKSSTVTTSLLDGTIYGLLKVRDSIIPDLITQLDTLADALSSEVNAAHNDGFGFPPPSSLTGTKATTSTTEVDFTGSVRIAVIKDDGTPALSPFSDETYYRPLTLDLSKLDSGSGAGRPTVQTIIDEINDYFGPAQNRAVVGNLRDIKLVAVSDSITDAGTAQFDLQLDNTSTKSATVVLQSVTVIDPIDSSSTYPAATLPSPNTYTIAAGGMGRTSIPLTVNFGAGDDNRASYTVRVRAQVTDADGNVSVADVDYTVSDNVTSIKNDRYSAQAVTNVSGTSQFYVSPGAATFASAALVDANGNAVSAGNSGYLKITTASGRNYSVVFDELDSKEVGVPGASSTDITNRGFSHYFGLNNLFVDHGAISGSAINMAVRGDIKTNPNLLATGQLTLSNQPIDTSTALYTYEAGSGNNKAALAISQLNQKSVFFTAAGDLPSINTTFGNYSADIIGSVATSALQSTNNKDSKQLGMDGLLTLFQEAAGVNSDEEMARIIELQNHFAASAKIINVVQKLYEILDQTIR